MGGDHGPAVAFGAAVEALAADEGLHVYLVGDPDVLDPLCARAPDAVASRLQVETATDVIPHDMPPSRALRQGAGSSLAVTLRLVREGAADAAVSAGNTGALMALGRFLLGTLPGIERPALMSRLPTRNGHVWALDLGANVGVDARRLYEFAVLGSAAVAAIGGRKSPRVGLLNVGVEANKGNDVVREAARLIEQGPELNYTGFVEADHVFEGKVDVVVCDGFAGNVLLKSAEGVAGLITEKLRAALDGSWSSRLAAPLVRRKMNAVVQAMDPSRHNGAPLLGINGIVIKSHGGADARTFRSAIELAALEARRNVIPEIERQLWASY